MLPIDLSGPEDLSQGFWTTSGRLARHPRPEDVATAVCGASRGGLPVTVQVTGHGLPLPVADRVLMDVRAMGSVHLDVDARTATVRAGTGWQAVRDAAVPHGLGGLCGSTSGTGVVRYTLGGGLPVLGRVFGVRLRPSPVARTGHRRRSAPRRRRPIRPRAVLGAARPAEAGSGSSPR